MRAVTGCFLFVDLIRFIVAESDKALAYERLQTETRDFLLKMVDPKELAFYDRILKDFIGGFSESSIESTQYVVHTLEAALWCVLRSGSFSETVLAAVNLGGDTDTIGALAGGLAGLIYGSKQIPEEWLSLLARKDDITDLAVRFARSIQ
jgi:ADP-ribosyl-[dinitrogen reductase] hydrolase